MAIGLDDVIAAETMLSQVDGEAGRLILRGRDLEELAGNVSYEEAIALLWQGFVPMADDQQRLRDAIGVARRSAFDRFLPRADGLAGLQPIDGMRFLLASLPDGDRDTEPALIVGAVAVAAALAVRAAADEPSVEPDPTATHAADVLRMLRGSPGDAEEIHAFEAYLVTVIEHGLNASTFTTRVVASTAAGLTSATVAALCALKGPLHGGAPGPVLDMLDAIAIPERADAWIEDALDRGSRLMGFGHRVYRVRDPRADVLKAAVERLKEGEGRVRGRANRIPLAEAVEAAALRALKVRKPGRPLDVNVEFYTALLLDALGVPRAGFTPVFAIGRSAGWVAHVREQEQTGRLMRPQSKYIGPLPATVA